MSFVTQINVSIKSYLSSYLEEQLTSISTQKIVIRQTSVVEPLRRLPSLLRCMCVLSPRIVNAVLSCLTVARTGTLTSRPSTSAPTPAASTPPSCASWQWLQASFKTALRLTPSTPSVFPALTNCNILLMYADVFLMENCMFLSKFLSRSWHLYFLQAAAQFEVLARE